MNCSELSDLYPLYALGLLDGPEREAVEEHLSQNCVVCTGEFHRAIDMNAQVFRAVPKMDPSAKLRSRVLAGFGIDTRSFWERGLPWAVAAFATVVMMMAIVPRTLQPGRPTAETTSQALEFLGMPGTRQVSFGTGPSAPHGSLLVQQQKGLLLVVVNLPEAASGKMYETWIVPRQGAPRPVGQLRRSKAGESVALIPGPFDAASLKAVAVSVEPSSDTPPTSPTTVLFAAAVN